MERFYKLKERQVINTVTDIPKIMWNRKGLLPYKIINISLPEGEEYTGQTGIIIKTDLVEDVIVTYYHVPTLAESKTKKILDLKNYMEPKFPEAFKQRNAWFDIYTALKKKELKDLIVANIAYIDDFETQINDTTTIDAVNAIDFRTSEDVLADGVL